MCHKVISGVSDQPFTLEETTQGAKNRARAAMAAAEGAPGGEKVQLGVGIESGLFSTDGKLYDVCACAIWDSQNFHTGCYSHGPAPCATDVLCRLPVCAASREFTSAATQVLVRVGATGERPGQSSGRGHGPVTGVSAHLRRSAHRRQRGRHRGVHSCSHWLECACRRQPATGGSSGSRAEAAAVFVCVWPARRQVMTGGRITRPDYTVQSIQMAVLALNPAHYACSGDVPAGINDPPTSPA